MRILKLGLISLVAFSIIFYLFSLLIPSSVRISRAINIGVGKDTVSAYLADIRNWQHWNEMVRDSAEIVANSYERKRFKGRELLVTLSDVSPDSLRMVWKHDNSKEIQSGFNLVQSLSDTTVTQWYFDFHLNWYPWEKFGSIIFDQQLGPAMEKSLSNLKNQLESSPQ
jgi:hypothetical protein